MENRNYNGTIQPSGTGRLVSGYAVRFDEVSKNLGFYEVIAKGAITEETIANSDIFALFNHEQDKVLARKLDETLMLELRDDGLFYTFEAPENELGDDLIDKINQGIINTSSFAFTVNDDDKNSQNWYRSEGKLYRTVKHIEKLFDVSPVYNAAYSTTSCFCRNMIEEDEKVTKKMDELTAQIESL